MNNVSINNVLAARVEMLQVREKAGDFETANPLTCMSVIFPEICSALEHLFGLQTIDV